MHNKHETVLMFIVAALLITGCIALRHGRRGMRDAAQEYQTIPRTITLTPVTVEWADRCEEDEPCWDCRTMGNRICGSQVHLHGSGTGNGNSSGVGLADGYGNQRQRLAVFGDH